MCVTPSCASLLASQEEQTHITLSKHYLVTLASRNTDRHSEIGAIPIRIACHRPVANGAKDVESTEGSLLRVRETPSPSSFHLAFVLCSPLSPCTPWLARGLIGDAHSALSPDLCVELVEVRAHVRVLASTT